jgi:Ribbon-helix-helix protein, copG family
MLRNKKNKEYRITVSLDEDVYQFISGIAKRNQLSIAWVIRYALDYFSKTLEGGTQLHLPFGRKNKI